jgi:uncharacterized protein
MRGAAQNPGAQSKRRWLALGIAIASGLGAWAFWWEPQHLVVKRVALDVPHWPAALAPLKIALLSDLHVGSPYWGVEEFARLVDTTKALQPDLVLLAGDYLINDVAFGVWVPPEAIAQALETLRPPLGVVAVLGNHDWWNDGYRVRRAFAAHGVTVLENEALELEFKGTRFSVVGLADELTRFVDVPRALAKVPSDQPFLVLCHEPDTFRQLGAGAALTLAGHTHGGQVRLPFVGAPVIPSLYGQRYGAGHVVEDGRHLYVTTGVGTSIFPVRFGVPPEVVLLSLNSLR